MVIRHALRDGRAAGLATAAGIAIANASWAVAAGLGITALLARAPVVFTAIRFGGAAFLAYLGVRALTRAIWPVADTVLPDPDRTATNPNLSSAFRDGVAVNLLNPPIATFYLAVVPSFMPAPSVGRFALLASIHITMAFVCHAVWAAGFDSLRGIWTRPSARRRVDAAVGIALLALAMRMLR
jgi:threonine/homoserine/homoserine lactone efflux protein